MNRIVLLIISLAPLVAAPPVSADEAECQWRGTAPLCAGRCRDDQLEITGNDRGDGMRCLLGKKVLCCPETLCTWRGRAPWCYATCEDGELAASFDATGPKGSATCVTGEKALCCRIETDSVSR